MKKIGIITITGGTNFGNRLQNYATQEILKNLGFNPETLKRAVEKKYSRNIKEKKKFKFTISNMSNSFKSRLNYKYDIKEENLLKSIFKTLFYFKKIRKIIKKRHEVFNQFNKDLINESDFQIGKEKIPYELLTGFDCFVCGSDQVWNPFFTQTSMIDFLTFTSEKKRISLSPSFGVDQIPENKKEIYAQWLNGIPFLSVREKKGADIIYELTRRVSSVLVDPTLLLSETKWVEIAKKPEKITQNPYIVVFLLGNKTKDYSVFINKISKQYSMEIINLCSINDLRYYSIGPREFIYLIKNASFICTDSFHGAAFSILMKRNFIVFNRVEGNKTKSNSQTSMISRLDSLLELFNLRDRFFANIQYENLFLIDFSLVDDVLKNEKQKAYEYLKDALYI